MFHIPAHKNSEAPAGQVPTKPVQKQSIVMDDTAWGTVTHADGSISESDSGAVIVPADRKPLYMEVTKPERADGRKAGKYTLEERKNCVTGEVTWVIRRQPINPKTGKPWQAAKRIATFDKPGLAVRAFIKV